MPLGVLDQSRGPDLLEEINPFRDEFFSGVPENELEKLFTEVQCLYFAIGKTGLYYLDDWTPEISNAFEKSVKEYCSYLVSANDFRETMHKYIRFIDQKRPFKHGLPI